MKKLIVAFRNILKVPKKGLKYDWLNIKILSQRTITSKVIIWLSFSSVWSENLFYFLKHDSSTNKKFCVRVQFTTCNNTPPAAAR